MLQLFSGSKGLNEAGEAHSEETCCVTAWGLTRQCLVILLGPWNLWLAQEHRMCTCSPPFKKCLSLKQLVWYGTPNQRQVLVGLRLLLHGPGWGWLLAFLNKLPWDHLHPCARYYQHNSFVSSVILEELAKCFWLFLFWDWPGGVCVHNAGGRRIC